MTSADLTSIDANPCPPGAEAKIVRNGDAELRVARWVPEGAKGTVVLAHGRTEFIEKYYEVIGELLARGFAVFSFDWRGQGMATRELEAWQRGHIENFNYYLADLDAIFTDGFYEATPGPRYVIAHSMGGNIMLRYLRDHPELAERAVLTAPMLQIGGAIAASAIRLLALGAISAGQAGEEPFVSKPVDPIEDTFEDNPVTSDPTRFERTRKTVEANPRLGLAGISWQWVKAAIDSIDVTWTEDFITGVKVPTLFVAAGRERIVDPTACKRFAAASKVCETVTIEGALHEIIMEKDHFRRQFWALFDEFVSRP